MADGQKSATARLAAKVYQDPDIREGAVDTSVCVSLRSSHLQAISLRATKKWELRSLNIKDAFLRADRFTRDVFLQAPPERAPLRSDRLWKPHAPADGLGDAPVAFRRPLEKHLSN